MKIKTRHKVKEEKVKKEKIKKEKIKTESVDEKSKEIGHKKSGILKNLLAALRHSATIRVKLIIAFLVPIAFIIILGVTSFDQAAKGLRSSYEESTQQAINMTSQYVELGVNSVESASKQYLNDNIKQKYFLGSYDYDASLKNRNFKIIKNDLFAKNATDDFISNISILSDSQQSATTATSIAKGICKGFFETEAGKGILNSPKVLWLGSDTYLDDKLRIGSEDYAMRLVRYFVGLDSLIVIDMDMDTIRDILTNMKFDQNGMLALVTGDGKEIIGGKDKLDTEAVFSDKDFYQKALKSDKSYDSFYVKYKGESHLFMYSKISETGAMICAIIPKSIILSKADKIKQMTIVIVIFACIIAVLIGFIISLGIDKTIRNIIAKLKKAAAGDLTVDFSTKRKDEFRVLIDEINNTFTNMKGLIGQVKYLSEEVSGASANVSTNSEIFLKTSGDISTAMNEIEQGVMQQAKDAEECLLQMDNLSKKIELMSGSTSEIGRIAEGTKKNIQEGTKVTQELTNQTKQTIEITTDIVSGIEDLSEKSMSIGSIINVINEISNQTNLLSLNASIEAARAGEVGKGFAVVASEIRNLADQTRRSVNDIKHIIESIQENTKDVVKTAKEAENVMVLQDTAVRNTAESYHNINESVDHLMDNLKMIIENVDNIEGARASTLGAIENISAVLEEIAASTNNVNQISSNQLLSVESLNQSAVNLNSNSEELVNEVQKFKI